MMPFGAIVWLSQHTAFWGETKVQLLALDEGHHGERHTTVHALASLVRRQAATTRQVSVSPACMGMMVP
jgi:hypothetical protein